MTETMEKMDANDLKYQSGFGNTFESEALEGALPAGQNNPQECPFGLYAEQLSGTAFTRPRSENTRSWLYRAHPSVQHSEMVPSALGGLGMSKTETKRAYEVDPNQMRWQPRPVPKISEKAITFLEGIEVVGKSGDPTQKHGLAIYNYVANASMVRQSMTNADGDLLIVPQMGAMRVQTEFGIMRVEPNEICVVQRGMRFRVAFEGEENRGYMLEIFSGHFRLPDLGPIGANGLANPWDFQTPVAHYDAEDDSNGSEEWTGYTKFGGRMFEMSQRFSPFNVVAYRGNYVPYKYDLRKFNCMNSVTYDHPDPSIYTVLTCPSSEPGTAVADFVIFPPRWMAMEHTFRPPWFHRNTMTEYMGMIWGEYDAKKGGFVPGGSSLHSCMSPHGPDAATFERFSDPAKVDTTSPAFFDGGLAFMFETTFMLELSDAARTSPHREFTYQQCWADMPASFDPKAKPPASRADNLLAWRASRASNGAKRQKRA
ncbi:Homogentisate 1,2-dioxygenase [Hondaea fermentalgiana]|uniref:homogentisate 1,2-dioxygenase n=1 Tax=Hondaea fermentalgiana TaxID=2315210 RepID=A0A2R5GVZ3_9STRA|nr:Homogentisate 1,2-dioxygenase [Hondaea fermentalgiana]|eukprot:GBG35010.1 Homogentisate 1,2-dioxygenase [Hondaea fermentalgiana]